MTDAWIDPVPTSGCEARVCSCASSSSSAMRIGPIFTIASSPRSRRDPCAAMPLVSISKPTKPRCATATCSSVGSATIAASAVTCSSTVSVPTDASSSSATAVTIDVAALVARVRGRDEHRRQRALHVVTAAPVQPATVDAGLERGVHARDAHRVEVAVQEERAAAAGARAGAR